MGGWCKERYNKDENNELEGLHQKPDEMEETRWEGQNFSEVVVPEEKEEEKKKKKLILQGKNIENKRKVFYTFEVGWVKTTLIFGA